VSWPALRARIRATTSAVWVASEALICRTPPPGPVSVRQASGSPSSSTSQSRTADSISVTAGLVDHSMPCTPRPAAAISPSTDAGDDDAGKYANQPGCCQWVMPGMTTRSRSSSTVSIASGSSGARSGTMERT
jgi:hypothetical protein